MCGIIGISVNENSSMPRELAKKMLSKLFLLSESRGKEASGFAFLYNEEISVCKTAHPISYLIRSDRYKNSLNTLFANNGPATGIGHSRLVTNGSEQFNQNNQPVIKSDIVGIHNGIVTNVDKLWKKYSDEKRITDLDTEVILTLLRRFYKKEGSLLFALKKVFKEIYGMTSIALMFRDLNHLLLATNNGSLYYTLGNDHNSFIFASEAYILKRIISARRFKKYFNRYQVCHLKPHQACLINVSNTDFEVIDFDAVKSDKDFRNVVVKTDKLKVGDISEKYDAQASINQSDNETLRFYIPSQLSRYFEEVNGRIHSLKRCTRCILPETFPFIEFDQEGVCNYCNNYIKKNQTDSKDELRSIASRYRSKNNEPDCIVPFSGGRDSSYGLHYIKNELDLNPITFTYDWGMVTDLARRNIARICGKLGVENILVSANIRVKRKNIRKNVLAWLKNPDLGMIPLFMAGDKQFFYYVNKIKRQTGIRLDIWTTNSLENTDFKIGLCGLAPDFTKDRIDRLSMRQKAGLASYYFINFVKTPAYLNSSIWDTLWAYYAYYAEPRTDYYILYDYIRWNEKIIEDTLLNEYDWETSPDTNSTWRIGDGTASFYNYIYYVVAGFTENDTFRSNQIREGMISRENALGRAEEENQPRFDSIKWYCDTIGIDFKNTIRRINQTPKLYPL